tara:strand:- start:491 stop:721 length:231 start_codon:yes stop_codon:yes gene_type:complete
MFKNLLYEFLRWSLRLHGFFHIGHVYSDVVVENWIGVAIGSYIILVELLSSFLIPNEHVHFRLMKTEVHEKCDNED